METQTPWLAMGIHATILGLEWPWWKTVGWTGNVLFFSRFMVQWWATERSRKVVVPPVFWWLSLAGSSCLLAYGIHRRDSVFVFAYAFTWIPYLRNLVIGRRAARAEAGGCCSHCGHQLGGESAGVP
jgi:lipid-A-disaccharide synthase-like uncharacterized protein